MRYICRSIVVLIILQCNLLFAQDVLQSPIVAMPTQLSYFQIVDSLNSRYQLQFSYDATLVTDTLRSFNVSPSTSIASWLNNSFVSDSSEWIFLESQVIIRRRRLVSQVKPSCEFSGVVVSQATNDVIPFASISVIGSALGVNSNEIGEFKISLPNSGDSVKLEVSSLGHQTTIVKRLGSDTNLKIVLAESNLQLPEVSVAMLDPNIILGQVVANRGKNYPNCATILNGFYRESILQKERYVDVTEAVVVINKPSYSYEYATEKVMVEKIRRYKDSLSLSKVNLRLEGGPFYFSQLDVARSLDFLPANSSATTYKYYYEGCDIDFGRTVYVVSFKPLVDNGDLLYTGTIYVDKESYAITSVHFQLSDGAIKVSKRYFVQSENLTSTTLPIMAKYQINYRPFNGQWMLSYVRGELKLKVSNKSHHINTTFTAVTELSISEANIGKYKIFKNGYVRASEIVSDRVVENSPLFWKDFNVIPPLKEVRMLFEEK